MTIRRSHGFLNVDVVQQGLRARREEIQPCVILKVPRRPSGQHTKQAVPMGCRSFQRLVGHEHQVLLKTVPQSTLQRNARSSTDPAVISSARSSFAAFDIGDRHLWLMPMAKIGLKSQNILSCTGPAHKESLCPIPRPPCRVSRRS
jgi:hypothetical protein